MMAAKTCQAARGILLKESLSLSEKLQTVLAREARGLRENGMKLLVGRPGSTLLVRVILPALHP